MLPNQRKEKIIEMLKEDGSAKVFKDNEIELIIAN